MAETRYHFLHGQLDGDVLIVTISQSNLASDESAEGLYQELRAAVAEAAVQKVILDFRNVVHLSSVAFRPLLGLLRRLRETGGSMVLCNLSKEADQIFRTTRLITTSRSSTSPFQAAPDLAAALARIKE